MILPLALFWGKNVIDPRYGNRIQQEPKHLTDDPHSSGLRDPSGEEFWLLPIK
jgi:hypothetical protein